MVGVPRSKACISCRARRKGCDAKRPSCGQCLRRRVACPGYVSNLNIVFEHPGSRKTSAATTPDSTARPGPTPRPTSPPPALQVLLPSCRETAFRSHAYGEFFATYLPHASGPWLNLPTDLAILPATSWLSLAATLAYPDSLSEAALTALALAHVARAEQRHDMLAGSRQMYLRTVQGLNKALNGKDGCLQDDTLTAVMALSIYEMQEGTSGRTRGWMSHVGGAAVLIGLRGRQNFATPLSQRLFLGAQLAEFISAIGSRRSSANAVLRSNTRPDVPFEAPIWSQIRLFEILHQLPKLMAQGDLVHPTPAPSVDEQTHCLDQMRSLAEQCRTFETRMTEWYERLESEYALSATPPTTSSPSSPPSPGASDEQLEASRLCWREVSTLYQLLPADSLDRIFPFYLCFPNPDVAEQVVLGWAALLLMHSTLHLAQGRCRQQGITAPGLVRMPTVIEKPLVPLDPHTLALFIAQSLEYFVHPDMGLLGTNFVGFPLAVAQGYFQHTGGRELRWFAVIFRRMREMNSRLGGFLDEMYKEETVRLVRP